MVAVVAVGFVALVTSAPPAPAGAAQPDPRVEVKEFEFSPRKLTVGQGTSVTWVLTGRSTHTITAEDGSFSSEELEPDATFAFRLERVGVVEYFCAIHPSRMRATVEVVAADIEAFGEHDDGISLPKLAGIGLVAAPGVFLLLAALFWIRPRST